MSDRQVHLVKHGATIHGGTYEIWDIGDGYGICVESHPCPWDAGEPDAVVFPYDLRRKVVVSWSELFAGQEDATYSKAISVFGTSQWRRQSMARAETVELPKDRKGRTLHVDDKVFVLRDGEPYAKGNILSMTLTCLKPVHWYVELHVSAIGYERYASRLDGFEPDILERIERPDDGSTD